MRKTFLKEGKEYYIYNFKETPENRVFPLHGEKQGDGKKEDSDQISSAKKRAESRLEVSKIIETNSSDSIGESYKVSIGNTEYFLKLPNIPTTSEGWDSMYRIESHFTEEKEILGSFGLKSHKSPQMNIPEQNLEFLYPNFEKRLEDSRYGVTSIGSHQKFLFNIFLSISIGSFGYALTLPIMTSVFIWSSVYFFVLASYLLLRGFRLQTIPPFGCDPRLIKLHKEFCSQDLKNLKLGKIEEMQEDIECYESLSSHLVQMTSAVVGLALFFPLLTVGGLLIHSMLIWTPANHLFLSALLVLLLVGLILMYRRQA